jgi:hypothetical protein
MQKIYLPYEAWPIQMHLESLTSLSLCHIFSFLNSLTLPALLYHADENVKITSFLQPALRIVVSGAKGSGKSTLVRYLTNQLLRRCPAVALLDSDLGQPELSPPGLTSLSLLRRPLLKPPYLSQLESTPELAFCLGDVSKQSNPGLALEAQALLFRKFRSREVQRGAAAAAATSARRNPFDDGSASSAQSATPLLVNTDGWLRSLGTDLLTATLDLVQPSVHIRLAPPAAPGVSESLGVPGPGSGLRECTGEQACRFVTLPSATVPEPGASTPPGSAQVASADLRLLRVAAHLLPDSDLVRTLMLERCDPGMIGPVPCRAEGKQKQQKLTPSISTTTHTRGPRTLLSIKVLYPWASALPTSAPPLPPSSSLTPLRPPPPLGRRSTLPPHLCLYTLFFVIPERRAR